MGKMRVIEQSPPGLRAHLEMKNESVQDIFQQLPAQEAEASKNQRSTYRWPLKSQGGREQCRYQRSIKEDGCETLEIPDCHLLPPAQLGVINSLGRAFSLDFLQ